MATDSVGDAARLYPWQVSHYIVHGGPNDPVSATAEAVGTTPATKGYLSFNSSISVPAPPGTAGGPSVQALNCQTGSFASNVLATSLGGIFIGTVPQGSWIKAIELFCYTAGAAATNTSVGVFYAPAGSAYVPANLYQIAYQTSPTAGLYSTRATYSPVTQFTSIFVLGPGSNTKDVTTTHNKELASVRDIDLYVVAFNAGGVGASTVTAGCYAVLVEFTGLEG